MAFTLNITDNVKHQYQFFPNKKREETKTWLTDTQAMN